MVWWGSSAQEWAWHGLQNISVWVSIHSLHFSEANTRRLDRNLMLPSTALLSRHQGGIFIPQHHPWHPYLNHSSSCDPMLPWAQNSIWQVAAIWWQGIIPSKVVCNKTQSYALRASLWTLLACWLWHTQTLGPGNSAVLLTIKPNVDQPIAARTTNISGTCQQSLVQNLWILWMRPSSHRYADTWLGATWAFPSVGASDGAYMHFSSCVLLLPPARWCAFPAHCTPYLFEVLQVSSSIGSSDPDC